MISLTKLPPPIPARSPRKSSGSAHMMLNPSSIGGEFPYRSGAGVLVYRKHMEKQAHLPAEKRFVSCKALVIENFFFIEHASVAWLGIFLQCSLPN